MYMEFFNLIYLDFLKENNDVKVAVTPTLQEKSSIPSDMSLKKVLLNGRLPLPIWSRNSRSWIMILFFYLNIYKEYVYSSYKQGKFVNAFIM